LGAFLAIYMLRHKKPIPKNWIALSAFFVCQSWDISGSSMLQSSY
jgi:hypothetical protein